MLNSIRKRISGERAAMGLVILASALTGRQAAIGMDTAQGMGALTAILGSAMVVVMIRTWPVPQKVRARRDD